MAASYPTSVKTFTTLQDNVDTASASNINPVYDEITAVEQGLLNGFQHDLKPMTTETRSFGSSVLRWLKGWFKDLDVSGTLTLPAQTANTVFAGPSSGAPAAPTFRTIVQADVPDAALGGGTPSSSTFLRGDRQWAAVTPTPGGSDTQVQFNDAGTLAGDAGLTYNKTTGTLTAGALSATGAVSGASASISGDASASTVTISGAAPATPNLSRVYQDTLVKAWASVQNASGTTTLEDDYNVASVTDNGNGDVTINFATALPTATYAAAVTARTTYTRVNAVVYSAATGSLRVQTYNEATATLYNADFTVIVIGG